MANIEREPTHRLVAIAYVALHQLYLAAKDGA